MNLHKYILGVHSKRLCRLKMLNSRCPREQYFFIERCDEKVNGKATGKFTAAYSSLSKGKEILKCYSCQGDINVNVVSFVCKNCKTLIDVEVFKRFNIFELFNLDLDYDIDKNLLRQKFNYVQKLFHPDKNNQSARLEKINEASSYLNYAYKVLTDDMERAVYLLEVLFNYKMDDNENLQDEEFLQEIIKINEQIDSSEDIESLTKQYEKTYQNHIEELRLYFKEKKCDKIVKTVKKLKFVDKILERIKNM